MYCTYDVEILIKNFNVINSSKILIKKLTSNNLTLIGYIIIEVLASKYKF